MVYAPGDTGLTLRDEVLSALRRSRPANLSNVRHESTEQVLTFRALRGGDPCTVRIKDLGPDYEVPELRYECRVVAGGVILATSNGGRTPAEAIHNTHWQGLRGLGTPARGGGDASGRMRAELTQKG